MITYSILLFLSLIPIASIIFKKYCFTLDILQLEEQVALNFGKATKDHIGVAKSLNKVKNQEKLVNAILKRNFILLVYLKKFCHL